MLRPPSMNATVEKITNSATRSTAVRTRELPRSPSLDSERCQEAVGKGAQGDHASPGNAGYETSNHVFGCGCVSFEGRGDRTGDAQHPGELHCELGDAANEDTPSAGSGDRGEVGRLRSPQNECDDDGEVPQHGGHVGQEEVSVRVQDAEAPGGEDDEADAGCHRADEFGNEVGSLVACAFGDETDDRSRRHHQQQDEATHEYGQNAKYCSCELAGSSGIFVDDLAVYRNERSGQCALAQQVLHHLGDLQ